MTLNRGSTEPAREDPSATHSKELTKHAKHARQPTKSPQAACASAEQFDKAAQTICAAGVLRVVHVGSLGVVLVATVFSAPLRGTRNFGNFLVQKERHTFGDCVIRGRSKLQRVHTLCFVSLKRSS